MVLVKNLQGGTTFYDDSGNKYIKLCHQYEVLQPHCCDNPTKSKVNCLLVIQGVLMWFPEDKWVETNGG